MAPWLGPGWLRRLDSNQRPSGYEPDELPLLHSAIKVYRRLEIGQPGLSARGAKPRVEELAKVWAQRLPDKGVPAVGRSR